MFDNGLFITSDTLSTITKANTGNNTYVVLRIYRNKQVIFMKEYKTFSAAKAQETKLLKKYRLSVY